MNIIFIIALTILGSFLMLNILISFLGVLIKLFGMMLICGLFSLGCYFLYKRIRQLMNKERK